MDVGTSFSERLARLEAQNEELSESLRTMSERILSDVIEQFYTFIVPRVDAVVIGQREILERQMIELWREFSREKRPMQRPGLPTTVTIRMCDAVTGRGWVMAGAPPNRDERWFSKTAFIAAYISPNSPVLLKLRGSAIINELGLSRLAIPANGYPLSVTAEK